jgi:hypothetical protein
MVDTINHLARALVTIHGADALKVAEHAAANVRGLGMAKALDEWNLVITAIKKIQQFSPAKP